MIGDLLAQKKDFKNIHLIFGTRYANGILYQDEFEKLIGEMSGFQFDVALSREKDKMDFPFGAHSGYVHPVYLEKYKTPDPNRLFYLCGWTEMVDEARKNLAELGYDRSQVKFELYG
jgi:CDP-4-dehydro-6-deoxyglucose reductase